ncbi:MAG: methyltransferase domain-containing protein [Phycisphaerae bacterium]|nr:methyltransferase domain-containing protein [Phycisphaerae bacterium]
MLSQLEQVSRTSWERNIDEFRLIWPDTEVVRFLGHTARRGQRSGLRVLDLGCGGGRHLACVAREGFEGYGIDYNAVGLEQARQSVAAEGQPSRVVLADVADPPFADERFDIVLAWGVLFHTTPDRAVTMLRQIRRLLKPGGRMLANWRSDEDDMQHRGKRVDERTYLMGDDAESGLAGTLYTFSARADLESTYAQADLRIDNLERRDLWINNLSMHCSWWIVWAGKPASTETER